MTHRAFAAALAVALFALSGCDQAPALQAEPLQKKAAATKVEAVRPARHTMRRVVEQPGQIVASEVTPIHAKISGYARSVAVDIGDRIKTGQVLAELDVPEIEAEAEQKRAMIDQAESRKLQAEAQVRVAQAARETAAAKRVEADADVARAEAELQRWTSEFRRVDQLVRESAATGSLLDEARSRQRAGEAGRDAARAAVRTAEAATHEAAAALEKARADVAAAASGVEVARAEARHAEAVLAYSRMVAPYDGVVVRRNIDTGHLTVPGPQGEPLLVLARTGVVTILVGVPEAFAGAVATGHRATIRVPAQGGRTIEGTVSRTSFALDAATRTLRAEIDLPNDDGSLRPGTYAYAAIVIGEHPDALTIPAGAVVRDGPKSFAVVVRDGRAVRQPIEIGFTDDTRAEVLSGLKGDEAIVRANAASLADGQPVEVAPAAPSGAKP